MLLKLYNQLTNVTFRSQNVPNSLHNRHKTFQTRHIIVTFLSYFERERVDIFLEKLFQKNKKQ